MKSTHLPLALLLLTVLGTSLPVEAQPGPGGGARFARERQGGQGGMERRVPPRRESAEMPRRGNDSAGDEDRRRRLTQEERRSLRRDIEDAGRDIYRPERPSRRFPHREP